MSSTRKCSISSISKVVEIQDREEEEANLIESEHHFVLIFRSVGVGLQMPRHSDSDLYALHSKINDLVTQYYSQLRISNYRQQLTNEFREAGNHIVFNFDNNDRIVAQSNEILPELK